MKKVVVLVLISAMGMFLINKPVKKIESIEIKQEIGLPIEAVEELRVRLNP
jgi:hypothetical protein